VQNELEENMAKALEIDYSELIERKLIFF